MMKLSQLRHQMRENGIVFSFTGYMTEEVLVSIGDAMKKKLELENTNNKTARGMFSVFVEMVQNIIRYSAENEYSAEEPEVIDLRYGLLAIGRKDGRNFIACGNLIEDRHVERLSTNLNHISSLDRDGLKTLYKETLRGDAPEGSKGAGVGFIEIARRATHGFEFGFEKVDDGCHFFTMTAYL